MEIRTSLILFLLLLLPFCGFAQRAVKVSAEYTYIAPENITIEQAKLTALDRAKIQAIADEFGTVVTQSNSTIVSNVNGGSKIDFQSIGGSDVKGEWIETIGEPEFNVSFVQNQLVVRVSVKGRIREITSTKIDLIAQVLCNGTTPQHERSEFKNGDDLYLRFQSPVDGYLLVYLLDYAAQTAYCLLPYSGSSDAAQKIEHDKTYIFFSQKDAPIETRNIVDEYTLTCSFGGNERNDIFVLFSPNTFIKANSIQSSELAPQELTIEDYNKWLASIRNKNNKLQTNIILLTINF